MPLKKCQSDDKDGWKWGKSGKCYTGPDAKKQAIKQGIAIEGPEKFSQKASEEDIYLSKEEIKSIVSHMYEKNYSLAAIVCATSLLASITEEAEVKPIVKKKKKGEEYTSFLKKQQVIAPPTTTWLPSADATKDNLLKSEYKQDQMQVEQLKKMHQQLMEIEEYLDGIEFEEWTKDMVSKAEIYIQNIYDFVKAKESEMSSDAVYKYKDPKTGEIYEFERVGVYKKGGRFLTRVRSSDTTKMES